MPNEMTKNARAILHELIVSSKEDKGIPVIEFDGNVLVVKMLDSGVVSHVATLAIVLGGGAAYLWAFSFPWNILASTVWIALYVKKFYPAARAENTTTIDLQNRFVAVERGYYTKAFGKWFDLSLTRDPIIRFEDIEHLQIKRGVGDNDYSTLFFVKKDGASIAFAAFDEHYPCTRFAYIVTKLIGCRSYHGSLPEYEA